MKKIILLFLILTAYCRATIIYADSALVSDCSGNYSIANHNCTGSDGDAYDTIQEAINAMSGSDTLYIREGTYYENVLINAATGIDGTSDNWTLIASYPGEWAIIDGQNNEEYAVGKPRSGRDAENDIEYIIFARLEITGGTDGSVGGAGLYISGGPFIVRYCYIHDNLSSSASENPAGLVGYCWDNCIVEYNYFYNNGTASGNDGNSANICVFTDYAWNATGEYGFGGSTNSVHQNEIRYNYISGSAVGFKHKGGQLFTGRNTGGADYDDTYDDWGDKIHHNVFYEQRRFGIIASQDFCQVYNNIFDDGSNTGVNAIGVNYEPDAQLYKVCCYNNLIFDPSGKGIVRYGCDFFSFVENEAHYGYDYNNIFDSVDLVYNLWFEGSSINVFGYGGGSRTQYSSPDISNYYCSNNYMYRPDDPDQYDFIRINYTNAEFEAQELTHTPRQSYTNAYDAGNLLYIGTTGADKYITDQTHVIEGATTVADGGIGGSHPFLSGVTIPSYVGPVTTDSTWVLTVVDSVTDATWLATGTGTEPEPPTPPAASTKTVNCDSVWVVEP